MQRAILAVLIIVLVLGVLNLASIFDVGKKVEEVVGIETKPLIANLSHLDRTGMIVQWIVTARGEVKEINNKTITLAAGNRTLVIPITNDATFARTISDSDEFVLEDIKFEDIKISDQVAISAEMNPDGTLDGRRIRILPET